MYRSLEQLLIRASEENPDGTALVDIDSCLSYLELYRAAKGLARSLITAGIQPGDRVGLCLQKSNDAIVAIYGVLLAGASYVPIDPHAPTERIVQVALNVETRGLVTTFDLAATIAPVIAEKLGRLAVFIKESDGPPDLPLCTRHPWTISSSDSTKLPAVDEDGVAYILHTSGSTGQPKGVAISHKSALTFVSMAADFFAVRQSDRLCSQAPLHFDLSIFDLFVACRQGATLILFPDYYSAFPKKYVSAIRDHGITIWNSVSSALTLMMDKGQPDAESMKSIRVVLFSGEAMPTKYLRMLQEHFRHADLYNGYGQTEANTSMYYQVASIPGDDWRVPLGKPFPQFDVFALDANGDLVDVPGTEGELYVCSDAVADGYWGNPQLTNSRFNSNFWAARKYSRIFRTGDNVRLNSDGDYEFVGRADNMIKSRGYRIELGEIEHVTQSFQGVGTAVCIAIPDDKIGNRLFAFISYTEGNKIVESELLNYLRQIMPAYMIPEKLYVQKELPRTPSGKIDRRALQTDARSRLFE